MFSRNKRGERRVSPPVYRFLLAVHVIVSVGWLGVVFAKLVLGTAAATADDPDAFYASMGVVDSVFPPAAVGTAVTGVLLSLGTKWGLLAYYWVVVKIGLTVGVVSTGVVLMERLIQRSVAGTPGMGSAQVSLLSLSVAHVLMLGAATVVSVYKPWGRIRPTRRGGQGT